MEKNTDKMPKNKMKLEEYYFDFDPVSKQLDKTRLENAIEEIMNKSLDEENDEKLAKYPLRKIDEECL